LQELQKALGHADEDKNILQLNDLSAVYGGIMSDWLK
jgi:hypothetical protein